MSFRRLRLVFGLEAGWNARRPLLWILVIVLAFLAWGLSAGHVHIGAGDASVGGTKAWITSQFAVAMVLNVCVFLFYSFFITVAAGLAVLRDDELKTGEILHATPMTPGEYVWGKFLAVLASFFGVLAIHQTLVAFFNHVVPNAEAAEARGPFVLANYAVPAIAFGLPAIVFIAGTAFWTGVRWRKPILVFIFPVVMLVFCALFLWNWSPTWLDPRINQALNLIDPAGFRWLNETWLKVDRGVDFYNKSPIRFDVPFVASRIGFIAIGLLSVLAAQRSLDRGLRGTREKRAPRHAARAPQAQPAVGQEESGLAVATRPLASLAMRSSAPGYFRGAAEVTRVELRELRSSPGLYLFVPLILLQTLGSNLFEVGVFQTTLLLTPGTIAARMMNTLTLLVSLLMLFYTVESLQRERATGLASIYHATPMRTGSILLGKSLANTLVGVAVVLACLTGCVIALLWQHRVGIDLAPFAIVWGLLLVPTYLLWTAFVTAVFAIAGNRTTTYGICLSALMLTGYLQFRDKVNWVGNWDLWNTVSWSDMGMFGLNGPALVLNRLMALALAAFFVTVAVRYYPRVDRDAVRTLHRLRPGALFRGALHLAPFAVLPLILGIVLFLQVSAGFQSETRKRKAHDYWKQNIATWKDEPQPAIAGVELDLELTPERRWLRSNGSYDLFNHHAAPLARFALTGGPHWNNVAWTLNGRDYKPEDRTRLYVFTPDRPLAAGDHLRLGFRFEGTFPEGITRNGGGTGEFILPSGIVLTSFTPSFVPVIGYVEEIGVEEEKNRYETRVYPDDFYEGLTEAAIGTGSTFTTRVKITAPAEYTMNSVGTLVSEKTEGGMKTVIWESDQPVRFWNVVGGKWAVKRGQGTALFYHPEHAYNIPEIVEALDAARRYYSEWFRPFPWRELKLSEFPDLARYAQGFPTNITFSEGIGFLTESKPRADAAFLVTAHESAHQWWGNMLEPGKGPGGNILAEGMSHFSTILLLDQVKGARSRMEFCKRIEENYGDKRQVDSERPMVKIDGSRPGDQTVTYDKGGWVFWMLLNHMGRDAALAGLREFMDCYRTNPDHPVLQDFTMTMREFASDKDAYDAFVQQWFHTVVVPEYRLSEGRRTALAGAGGEWEAAVRVENAGSGRMPIEIAAVRGDRFDQSGAPSPDYKEARLRLELGAGESKEATIRCAFEPERVVVDPDVMVLQLQRKSAVLRGRLEGPELQ